MLGHLDELKRRHSKHAIAIDWLRGRLDAARETAQNQTNDAIVPAKTLMKLEGWATVRDQLCEAHDAPASLLSASLHEQLDAFVRQADRFTNDSTTEASPRSDPHALRIAGKYRAILAGAVTHRNHVIEALSYKFIHLFTHSNRTKFAFHLLCFRRKRNFNNGMPEITIRPGSGRRSDSRRRGLPAITRKRTRISRAALPRKGLCGAVPQA